MEGVKKQTLNTADTVWKEEPFFFPPFLLAPESPGDRQTQGICLVSPEDIVVAFLPIPHPFY